MQKSISQLHKFTWPWVVLLASLSTGSVVEAQLDSPRAPNVDQLLHGGRYSQIPFPKEDDAHAHAAWAFAQYYLAPGKTVAKSAQLAHEKGDSLGSFVLMMCHRTGSGLRRNRGEVHRLNFDLRTKLEKLPKPSSLELYMLSQCGPGDETGKLRNPDAGRLFADLNRHRELSAERLQKSADLGFAQACQEVALSQDDPAAAHKWHRKAAELGLAEGLRYAGIQMMLGAGVEADATKGLELSRRAAERGDAYAMINLVVFYDQGKGVKKDPDQAQRWLDAAAQSGHWYGSIEKGFALLAGNYGSKMDHQQGLQVLQNAVESGHGDALMFIAKAYAKGFGLKKDGKMAVRFAEAAYRQGNAEAASVLAFLYSEGLGEVKADKELAGFWGREASKPGFGLDLMQEKAKEEFLKRMDAIDPFALTVE